MSSSIVALRMYTYLFKNEWRGNKKKSIGATAATHKICLFYIKPIKHIGKVGIFIPFTICFITQPADTITTKIRYFRNPDYWLKADPATSPRTWVKACKTGWPYLTQRDLWSLLLSKKKLIT